MITKIKNIKSSLKTWLFDKPSRFTIWFLLFSALFIGASYIPGIEKIPAIDIITVFTGLIVFIFITRKLITSLPYKDISHSDFVALINGYKFTSIIFLGLLGITKLLLTKYTPAHVLISSVDSTPAANAHVISDTLFNVIEIAWFILAVYLLGLCISSIYVKYKRAKDMGISGWKVVLSMPFTFMMAWMPGYLTSDKKTSNIIIQSNWYSRFNKWVVSNFNNTLFMFLVLFVFSTLFVSIDISTILFPLMMFAIYMLWKTLAKESFSRQINRGYIWTAMIVNISMVILFVHTVMVIIPKVIQ